MPTDIVERTAWNVPRSAWHFKIVYFVCDIWGTDLPRDFCSYCRTLILWAPITGILVGLIFSFWYLGKGLVWTAKILRLPWAASKLAIINRNLRWWNEDHPAKAKLLLIGALLALPAVVWPFSSELALVILIFYGIIVVGTLAAIVAMVIIFAIIIAIAFMASSIKGVVHTATIGVLPQRANSRHASKHWKVPSSSQTKTKRVNALWLWLVAKKHRICPLIRYTQDT